MAKRVSRPSGEPSWKWRRSVIFLVVIWACYRLAVMENGPDTRVNDSIAFGWQVIIAVLVLGYTGFATVQDVIAIWTTRSAVPYSLDQQPQTVVEEAATSTKTTTVREPSVEGAVKPGEPE